MDMHGFHTPAREDRYLLSPPSSCSIMALHTLGKGETQVQFLLGAPIFKRRSVMTGDKSDKISGGIT